MRHLGGVMLTRWCYISNIKAQCFVVSDEKIFKVFISKICISLCDLDMQWSKTIWAIIKEDHIIIIPAKYVENPVKEEMISGINMNVINQRTFII